MSAAGRALTHLASLMPNTWESTSMKRYIELARNRYHRDFLVADVTTSEAIPAGSYDFILVNSFLHHIDTPDSSAFFLARANF
jgi:hypothetical protein